jgi:hypothetical protein
MRDILDRTPARSMDDAVALMTAIDRRLPDDDGLKWFNRLYLNVTVSVREAAGHAAFADVPFLAELDIAFANLYFAAIDAAERDLANTPSAWRPLLSARQTPGLARLQFALAGMNAHINRDLPEGIVQAFRTLGGDPITAEARRQDFDSVNEILERVEQSVKTEFSVGLVGAIDRIGGQLDDVLAMWNVRAARATAWTNAEVLWALGHVPRLRQRFFTRLDGLTGLASRGLLRPLAIATI